MKTCQPMFYVNLNALYVIEPILCHWTQWRVSDPSLRLDDNLDHIRFCDFSYSL